MKTLEDARRYQKHHPELITIERETRYFAMVNGVRYELIKDWELQQLDEKLWVEIDAPGVE